MSLPNDLLQNITVTAEDGVVYPLRGGRPCSFMWLNGAGVAPIRRITQRSPLQDGVVDRGYRLNERQMTLGLYIPATSAYNADQAREMLAYIFSPTTTPLKLTCTRLDGTVRQIDCFTNGTISFEQSERSNGAQQVVVPLLAPDPTFYDPTQVVQTASLVSSPNDIFPNVTGMTAQDWPIIEVTGPVTSLEIFHGSVGETIVITGTIPALETWRFDLRSGQKTLKRVSDGASRLTYVNTANLAGFSTIQVRTEKEVRMMGASPSLDTFTFSGVSTTAATSVSLKFYRRFLSL